MMIKTTVIALLLFASILLSYFTLLLPQTYGITIGTFENRQTQTTEYVREIYAGGFPIKFYLPGDYDYGANFMMEGFVVNTIVIFLVTLFFYIAVRKFILKQN